MRPPVRLLLACLAGLAAGLGLAGCGDGPPDAVALPTPDLFAVPRDPAHPQGPTIGVAPAQIAEARALGVPPAITAPDGAVFVYVPRGSFVMGSPEDEPGRASGETAHKVHIDRGFYLEAAPGPGRLTFAEAEARAARLRAGDPVHAWRLPTEAEWEYAARAGATTRWWWGDRPARDAGAATPNPWGLVGMGWAPEWCGDRFGALPSWEVSDPTGAESGARRVRKGLAPDAEASSGPARPAARHAADPDEPAVVRLMTPVGYGLGRYGSVQVTFRLVDEEGRAARNEGYDLRLIAMNDRLAARTQGVDPTWARIARPTLPLTLAMVPGSYYVYAEGRRDGQLVRGTEQKFHVQGEAVDRPVPVPAADLSRFGSGAHEAPR